MTERAYDYIKENWFNPLAYWVGFASVFLGVKYLFDLIFPESASRLINIFFEMIRMDIAIPTLAVVIWTIIWFKNSRIPKSKKNIIGIYLCIKTENSQDWARVKSDLIEKLNREIKNQRLDDKFELYILNRYFASKYNNLIESYSNYLRSEHEDKPFNKSEVKTLMRKWTRFYKITKGQMYVYGEVIKRNSPDNLIKISLEAVAFHSPVTKSAKVEIYNDFKENWFHNEIFFEKRELEGWSLTTTNLYLSILYILGTASLISRKVEYAFDIHKKLREALNTQTSTKSFILNMKRKIPNIIVFELNTLGKQAYFERNITKARNFNEQALQIHTNNYGALLLKATLEVENRDIDTAIETIIKSKQVSGGDLSWRYSLGFLYFIKGDYEKSLKIYYEISNNSFPNEQNIALEVCDFIENYIQQSVDANALYFCLGFIYLKKLYNYPMAYDSFMHILQSEETEQVYPKIMDLSIKYLDKTKGEMELTD